MILGLAAAALTAIAMILVAITGGSDADNALTLLVVGGVILLIDGLAMIAYAVWPDGDRDDERYEYEEVSWWGWLEGLLGTGVAGPAQASRYHQDPEWTIPGWEPPETLEQPTLPAPREPRRPEPRPPRERRPPERRQPRPQLSKYD